jgi:hypothetical protein
MKLLGSLDKLANEHGTAAVLLEEHLPPAKEESTSLGTENENEILRATLKQRDDEKAALEIKISELHILLENANNEIKNFADARKALHDQPKLLNRIRQLESLNTELERQLRWKLFRS